MQENLKEVACDGYVEAHYPVVYFCVCLKLSVIKKVEKKCAYKRFFLHPWKEFEASLGSKPPLAHVDP